MRRFVYLLLFIFAPGNTLLKNKECGGKINSLLERSGSIQYPSHPDNSVFTQNTNNSTTNLLDVTCTWIIDSYVNQTVWIEVIFFGNGSYLGIQFGNEPEKTCEKDEHAVFSGAGRTIIQWRTVNTSGALHLRWNTSDSTHDPALIPYTHSDAVPVSPSPSGSNRVTYTPNIPGRGNVTPKTHTPRDESVQRGKGVSDPADKSRPLFPQDNTNNEQEAAGEWISDLSHAGTNSYTDTHSGTDANSASNTHELFIAWSSTAVQSSPSLHTTPKQSKTSTVSLLDDVSHTEKHTGSSQRMDTYTFTKDLSNTLRAKRDDLSSIFPTASFLSVNPHNRDTSPFNKDSKQEDFTSDSPNRVDVTTLMDPNTDVISEEGKNQFHVQTPTITHENQPVRLETDKTDHFSMSAHSNVNVTNQYTAIYDDSYTNSTPVVSEFPNVNQSNPLDFPDSNTTKSSGHLESVDFTSEITEPPMNVTIISTIENEPTTLSRTETIQPLMSSEGSANYSHTMQSQHNSSTQQTSSEPGPISPENSDLTSHNSKIITSTTPPDLTPAEGSSTPELFANDCHNLTCTSYVLSTVKQNEEQQESLITTSPSIPSSGSSSSQMNPNVTSDLTVENITTVRFESRTDLKEPDISPSQVQNTISQTNSPPAMLSNTPEVPKYTTIPQYSPSSLENTHTNIDISVITHTSSGQTAGVSNSSPTQRSSKMTYGSSPFNDVQTRSSSVDITSTHISAVSIDNHTVTTSTPVSITTSNVIYSPSLTTKQSTMTTNATSTEKLSVQPHTHTLVQEPSTIRPPKDLITSSHVTRMNDLASSTQAVTQTSRIKSTASSSDRRWPHGKHFFIVEDQPAIIKEERFQVLLQITLEDNFKSSMRLLEMEPFLQSVSGYQSQHVTWHSGAVLQTVVNFQTVKTLSWLGRAESLLQEAGLNPLPRTGVFVGGVRVKNIIVGGLHTDVCEWLFECPSGFQCVSSKTNVSCTSVCHSDYCKHQGICVHRPEQQPLCQCPVGEDYWFMGQRCDLRMTRPRLVGVCFGVLIAVAAVMALLSYLAVRRFKSMLMQAKVEQTRSSYRRFNHFDELSARFWGRSWPGSDDSLDNPVFTRSDELLHLRALDRTCCYHDDTLSVVSTYHGSGTHLNTIYPQSSQYGWDLSNCSLADGVVDSGKASDLSVCSWPIEPIQWTPFPLLQQLNRNTTPVKVSRPRSYCEGMELVDLEKSWTA